MLDGYEQIIIDYLTNEHLKGVKKVYLPVRFIAHFMSEKLGPLMHARKSLRKKGLIKREFVMVDNNPENGRWYYFIPKKKEAKIGEGR